MHGSGTHRRVITWRSATSLVAILSTCLHWGSPTFFTYLDDSFAISGLLVITLTSLGLIGNLARVERRLFVEVDALLILIGYLGDRDIASIKIRGLT